VKLHVLGCHGSDGFLPNNQEWASCHTCGFLLNDTLLLDAGTIASQLPLNAQAQIRHIVLSHLHFDHIKGLPTFADNLSELAAAPIIVAGIPEITKGLHEFIFNTHVYPDFFQIPSLENPVLKSFPLRHGNTHSLSGFEITPVAVNHTVPTTGFVVQDHSSALLYSGDTYSTDDLWQVAHKNTKLRTALIECSYPDSMADLARLSKHLTPALLKREVMKLDRPDISIYAYHLKPAYKDQIRSELAALELPNLKVLEEGEILEV
jgi:ribonuclease BN (tRNA processing enzyme)